MEKSAIIERFGGLIKEEPLTCLNDESLMPNACVLEAVAPFKGYYAEVTESVKPSYFYLMLEGQYSIEHITRATLNIRKSFKHEFDAVAGYISFFDHYHRAIRLRNLEDFSHIGLLQKLYKSEGIIFHKKVKMFKDEKALISISKLFWLEPVGELMFMDSSQAHHGYFILPRYVSWVEFKKLSKEAKYDTSILFFDAATAFIYENGGITDLVRVYKENLTIENLSAIRNRYLDLLK